MQVTHLFQFQVNSDVRIGLKLITRLLVSWLYISLQEFAGLNSIQLYRVNKINRSYLLWGQIGLFQVMVHLGLLVAIVLLAWFLRHQLYNISLRRYLSAQLLLSTMNFLLLMPAEFFRLDGCMSMVNEVPFPVP